MRPARGFAAEVPFRVEQLPGDWGFAGTVRERQQDAGAAVRGGILHALEGGSLVLPHLPAAGAVLVRDLGEAVASRVGAEKRAMPELVLRRVPIGRAFRAGRHVDAMERAH